MELYCGTFIVSELVWSSCKMPWRRDRLTGGGEVWKKTVLHRDAVHRDYWHCRQL